MFLWRLIVLTGLSMMSKKIIMTAMVAIIITGCNSAQRTDGFGGIDAILANPQGIEIDGKWSPLSEDTRNIYYNEFKKGRFAAYTADGKNTLALGSYSITTTGLTIQYFSEAQKREVTSKCVFETYDVLACTVENEEDTIRLERD